MIPDEQRTADIRSPHHELVEGDRIGAYVLRRKLGEGGMGEVYEAEQESPIRRRVALKLLRVGMDSRELLARFESERQALALMSHPNIARVLDAGATTRGRPYFVMEYVAGIPITEYADLHRLTTAQRIALFSKVCEAVEHAHQKGIIHRDLKPSNVLVAVEDGVAVPKVIDFGVAKAMTQKLTELTLVTQFGQHVGTPEYMSPEQAEMSALDVDTRTDVYSLGMLLYELLVWALPFERGALYQGSLFDLSRRIWELEPPRPSTRVRSGGKAAVEWARLSRTTPKALERSLRGDLDWIVMKAIEKDRTRRYGAVSELAADLRRHQKHEPVMAGPPHLSYRLKKFARRNRAGVIAGGLLALALLLGAAGTVLGLMRALRAEATARQEAATARSVSDFLVGLFDHADPGKTRGNTVTAREILDRGAAHITRDLRNQPAVQARLMMTMGHAYGSLGLGERSEPLLRRALELSESLYGPNSGETARALEELGGLLGIPGRPLLERALHIQERLYGRDDERTADVLWMLANTETGPAKRRILLERVRDIYERVLGPTNVKVAWCVNDIGTGYIQEGDYLHGLPWMREALRLKRITLGPEDWDVAITENNLGLTLAHLGRFQEAEPLIRHAVAVTRRTYGWGHPASLNYMQTYGDFLRLSGHPMTALDTLFSGLNAAEKTFGPDHGICGEYQLSLGLVYEDLGKLGIAEARLRRAFEIEEVHRTSDDSEILPARAAYASLLRKLGRGEQAAALERNGR